MPLMWIEPDVMVEHNGKVVYHAYKNDNYDDVFQYHYTTDVNEDSDFEFDIRDLEHYDDDVSHENVLKQAIEQDVLAFPE